MDDKWRSLLVPSKYGLSYPDDFDRNREYEFKRIGDDNSFRMRLAEQSPYSNVAGLMWREVNQEAPHSTPERQPVGTSTTPKLPAWPANTQEQAYRAQSPAQAIQGRLALPDRSVG